MSGRRWAGRRPARDDLAGRSVVGQRAPGGPEIAIGRCSSEVADSARVHVRVLLYLAGEQALVDTSPHQGTPHDGYLGRADA